MVVYPFHFFSNFFLSTKKKTRNHFRRGPTLPYILILWAQTEIWANSQPKNYNIANPWISTISNKADSSCTISIKTAPNNIIWKDLFVLNDIKPYNLQHCICTLPINTEHCMNHKTLHPTTLYLHPTH